MRSDSGNPKWARQRPVVGKRFEMIRTRLVRLGVLSLLMSAVAVWSGAGPVQADDEYNWWYEALGVPQAQAQGITGEGVPVAVIDWGIDPGMSLLSGAHLTVREPSFCMETQWYADVNQRRTGAGYSALKMPAAYDGLTQGTYRGTNTVARLVGNGRAPHGQTGVSGISPGADIRFYGVLDAMLLVADQPYCGAFADAQAMAIVQAVDDGARIILLQDEKMELSSMESAALAYALHEKVIVVAPIQRPGSRPESSQAWGLNGVVSVEAAYLDGRPHGISSTAPPSVTLTAPGESSAQGGYNKGRSGDGSWDIGWYDTGPGVAATLVAGMLADAAQKWPQATNHQLVQSLIRTGPDGQVPIHDPKTGYGAASLLHLLEIDPTRYEDVNPLVVPDDGQPHGMTALDIADAQRPVWADPPPPATAAPAASLSPAFSSGSPSGAWAWVCWVAAALAMSVALALALALVRRTRARRRSVGPSDQHDRQTTTSTTEEGEL